MKLPSRTEVRKARYQLTQDGNQVKQLVSQMDWIGVGWHLDELAYGILIGLKIAESRMAPAADPSPAGEKER